MVIALERPHRIILPDRDSIYRYEILSALGEGGMDDVYLARDTRLDRTVAIEAVREELSQDQHAASAWSRARLRRCS
jgi:serine/threonine protein kinase